MLTVYNLTKKYGHKTAINQMNVTFKKGVTGLLGPNGAGKSTLMRILATIDTPTNGTITFEGKNILEHPNALRCTLGYLPQDFGVYPNMSAFEFLEYMAAMKSLSMRTAKKRIVDLLNALNLAGVGKKRLGDFSGGMKQRVGIAQALLNDPGVLIIDEPTVGLDPEERMQFRNLLASLAADRIIILSTHIVSDIESIASNLVVVNNGNLVTAVTPKQLMHEANGKVWNACIPVEKLDEVQQRFIVSNSMQRADGIHVRIVCENKPSLNAVQAEPTLEDAYLWLTGRKEAVI